MRILYKYTIASVLVILLLTAELSSQANSSSNNQNQAAGTTSKTPIIPFIAQPRPNKQNLEFVLDVASPLYEEGILGPSISNYGLYSLNLFQQNFFLISMRTGLGVNYNYNIRTPYAFENLGGFASLGVGFSFYFGRYFSLRLSPSIRGGYSWQDIRRTNFEYKKNPWQLTAVLDLDANPFGQVPLRLGLFVSYDMLIIDERLLTSLPIGISLSYSIPF